MSYSRWSHSKWYTFHDARSGQGRDEQVFTVMPNDGDTVYFKFPELKNDIDDCLKRVNGDEELREYMTWFIEEIERRF